MKKLVLSFSVIICVLASCQSENKTDQAKTKLDSNLISGEMVHNPRTIDGMENVALPTMDFVDTVHDFGTINEGEIATYDFEFTNNGQAPLIVNNVAASCGCTTPEKPTDPILPGEKSKIKVSFDSNGRPGVQEKTISVVNNALRASRELKIKMEVKPKS